MKILVIGSGGREHALAWKLAQSGRATEVWVAPGNGGTAGEQWSNHAPIQNIEIATEDFEALTAFASEKNIELTVVGPDNPLALGVVDFFQSKGLRIWGPNKQAAQFEASKAFAQGFMERWGIPTARSGTFSDARAAKAFAASLQGMCAVKANGLALGKGVLLCQTLTEADAAINDILIKRVFGDAGDQVVIQEFLEGTEISLHAICDGRTARLFPTSQDHKRALDGDEGLNTGGMGAYSPTPFLGETEMRAVNDSILTPWLKGCAAEGIDYRGILYPGIMLTSEGPKVLEFNCRFGDPETQVYLTRLENDLLDLVERSLAGTLDMVDLAWKPKSSVCVVMASGGYPGPYKKGIPVLGLEALANLPDLKVFHAGTALAEDQVVTNGGRVLGVTALGQNLRSALDLAYKAVEHISFEGAQFRRDIGAKALT